MFINEELEPNQLEDTDVLKITNITYLPDTPLEFHLEKLTLELV